MRRFFFFVLFVLLSTQRLAAQAFETESRFRLVGVIESSRPESSFAVLWDTKLKKTVTVRSGEKVYPEESAKVEKVAKDAVLLVSKYGSYELTRRLDEPRAPKLREDPVPYFHRRAESADSVVADLSGKKKTKKVIAKKKPQLEEDFERFED